LVHKKKEKIMLVVSTREFRDKQARYFDCVDNGELVIVQRGKNKAYTLSLTKEEDMITNPVIRQKIERGMAYIQDGIGREYSLEELKTKMGV
jgi:PHD/YefM family antitoxin component YafN of YafNO toxin-antitoxin module